MLLSNQKKVSPDFFDGNLAGQHASHYGGNWNSGARRTARVATPSGDGDDGITGGCNPQQHNPESLASNRESYKEGHSACTQCVRRCGSNYWRPDTHGDKSDGFYPYGPAARDALEARPAEECLRYNRRTCSAH